MGCVSSKQLRLGLEASAVVLAGKGALVEDRLSAPFYKGDLGELHEEEQHQEEHLVKLPALTGPTVRFLIPAEYMQGYDEAERVERVRELGALGTSPDQRFSDIVSLMRNVFEVALAAVSLVESGEICFFAPEGFPTGFCGAPRVQDSFCSWVILPNVETMVIVEDTLEDFRFKEALCVVNPPHVRFYAGAPMISTHSGHRYGALFLMDTKPHRFAPEKYALLAHFAELVTRELEKDVVLRWQQKELAETTAQRTAALRAIDSFSDAVVLCDTARPGWPIVYVNPAFEEAAGLPKGAMLSAPDGPTDAGRGFWRVFGALQVDGVDPAAAAAAAQGADGLPRPHWQGQSGGESLAQDAADCGKTFHARVMVPSAVASAKGASESRPAWLDIDFKPAGTADQLRDDMPHVGIPSYIAAGGDDGEAGEGAGPTHYYFGVVQRLPPGLPSSPAGGCVGGGRRSGDRSSGNTISSPTSGGISTPSRNSEGFGNLRAVEAPLAVAALREAGAVAKPQRDLGMFVPSFALMRPKGMEDVIVGTLIGSGSNGRCYRGLWHGGHVALKVLDCWFAPGQTGVTMGADGELVSVATREAVLSRSLAHPYIVTTFDYAVSSEDVEVEEPEQDYDDYDDDILSDVTASVTRPSSKTHLHQQVWMLQSYCNRGTLIDGIERGLLREADGSPKAEAILATAREVASAMMFIHGKKVLHGDLTARNVLLTSSNKDGRHWISQVADFGMSTVAGGTEGVHTTKSLGTVTHMPPELLTEGMLSPATDVYSFGVILWEMWAGRRSWAGLSPSQIAHGVTSGRKLPSLDAAPAWLEGLMWRCLDPVYANRPTFEAIVDELGTVQLGHGPAVAADA